MQELQLKPEVSIIMPAYNVEQYIGKAIASIIDQTYTNWELIVIDDHSTDDTCKKVEEFRDQRIKLTKRCNNSGSAYIPRSEGVNKSQGVWIVNIDADDYIERNYIESLLDTGIEKGVDICGSQMIRVDENGDNEQALAPKDDFEFESVFTNIEAFRLTVPEWKIGMNGALVKKHVWERALSVYVKQENREIHDDETLSRIILLESNGFVATRARYYFRSNQSSVTKRFSLKTFNWRKSNQDLLQIAEKYFGKESEEYKYTVIYDYYCYKSVLSSFFDKTLSEDTFSDGLRHIKKWHDEIDWNIVINREPGLKTNAFRKLYISLLIEAIKHLGMGFWRYGFRKVKAGVSGKIKQNHLYAWYITRRKREQTIKKELTQYYCSHEDKTFDECVLCIYDGMVRAGGLADRLKGIIGTYYMAKQKKIPFKLYFISPFNLSYYLVPNSYNWSIDEKEICKNINNVELVILDNTQDSDYQIRKQQEYLERKIRKCGKQIHVYTNASFSYGLEYAELFGQLFKPSERLQRSIQKQINLLGESYLSVSCRFLDLLNDFNETFSTGKVLSKDDIDELLSRIKKIIEELHHDSPDKKILVNSDSITFLNSVNELDYTYIIPGNITHIDANQDESSYEYFEKTFLDFFLIANAERIYLIKSKEMFKSGYPYAASKVYNRPFEIIEI